MGFPLAAYPGLLDFIAAAEQKDRDAAPTTPSDSKAVGSRSPRPSPLRVPLEYPSCVTCSPNPLPPPGLRAPPPLSTP